MMDGEDFLLIGIGWQGIGFAIDLRSIANPTRSFDSCISSFRQNPEVTNRALLKQRLVSIG